MNALVLFHIQSLVVLLLRAESKFPQVCLIFDDLADTTVRYVNIGKARNFSHSLESCYT